LVYILSASEIASKQGISERKMPFVHWNQETVLENDHYKKGSRKPAIKKSLCPKPASGKQHWLYNTLENGVGKQR
jgi:hypothetical protein